MPYLDKAGLTELWSNIKANFGHYMQSTTSDAGAVIKLYSGSNGTLGTDVKIPPATDTTCGIMTGAQASKLASLQTYTAGTNISISGGQISVIDLAKVATSGAYSDLSGTPASLKNPNALTIGDVSYDGSAAKTVSSLKNPEALNIYKGYTPDASDSNVTYDGSTAVAINAMYGGVVIQQSWDFNDIETAIAASQTPVLAAFIRNDVTEPTWVYLFCTGLHEQQNDDDTTFYMFSGIDWHGTIYITECHKNGSVDNVTRKIHPLDTDRAAELYLTQDTAATTYAKLAGATFTGAVTLPTISGTTTNDDTAATTAFVQAVVKASGAGVVHYKGAAASTEKLTNYVTGDYWVASATFTLGSQTIESGDMIFANKTATDFVADNFDVVQANITAMTTAEVDNICKLDQEM